MALERGEVLGGHFEVERELASDFGYAAYRARHLMTGKPTVLKVLVRAKTGWADPYSETLVTATSSAEPPMVACVGEGSTGRSGRFFAFEWVNGETLADRLPNPLAKEEVLAIGAVVAEALAQLHRHGLAYGSLRPSRVILSRKGPRLRDPIVPPSHRTLPIHAAYLAPEVVGASGEESPSAEGDVYALGALLYHALTGRPPHQGGTLLSVLLAGLFDLPADLPASLDPLGPWIMRMLAPEPLERPRAARIDVAFRALLEGGKPGSVPPPSSTLERRSRAQALGGLLLVRGMSDELDAWSRDMDRRGGVVTRLIEGTCVVSFDGDPSALSEPLIQAANATSARGERLAVACGLVGPEGRSEAIAGLARLLSSTPLGMLKLDEVLTPRAVRLVRGGTVRGGTVRGGTVRGGTVRGVVRSTPKLGMPTALLAPTEPAPISTRKRRTVELDLPPAPAPTIPPPSSEPSSPRRGRGGTLVIEPELPEPAPVAPVRGGTQEIELPPASLSDHRPTLEKIERESYPTCEIQIEPSDTPTLEIEVDERLIERSRPSTQGTKGPPAAATKTARGSALKSKKTDR